MLTRPRAELGGTKDIAVLPSPIRGRAQYRRRPLRVLVSIGALLALAATFGVLPPPVPFAPAGRTAYAAGPQAPSTAVVSLEHEALELVNADRAAHGLAPLALDSDLATIARWRSEDMATAGYFSHRLGNTPGRYVFDVLRAKGVGYRVAGENLAYNYYSTDQAAAQAEAALMNSPTHRANILRPDYTHVGIGVATAPDGRVLVTQLFTAP